MIKIQTSTPVITSQPSPVLSSDESHVYMVRSSKRDADADHPPQGVMVTLIGEYAVTQQQSNIRAPRKDQERIKALGPLAVGRKVPLGGRTRACH